MYSFPAYWKCLEYFTPAFSGKDGDWIMCPILNSWEEHRKLQYPNKFGTSVLVIQTIDNDGGSFHGHTDALSISCLLEQGLS